MLIQPACDYLFQNLSNDVYQAYHPHFSIDQVNEHLTTLMKVNVAFLSRKENDGFPFIDPVAFNNQCHLYSFMACQIKVNYKEKNEEEKLEQSEENRFLHLAFLLSYTFLNDRNLLCQTIETAERKQEVKLPKNKQSFYTFVKNDTSGALIRTSRLSLNEVFERTIKGMLKASQEKNALYKELYHLSLEDLKLPVGRTQIALFTFPKIAGIAFLIQEQFNFVVKTKIVNSEDSNHLLIYQNNALEDEETPVLVFEAITSEDYSIQKFIELAKRCPSYFERNPSRKQRHNEGCCVFCNPIKTDVSPYLDRFKRATESIEATLYALGADFLKDLQPEFVKFFNDSEKYPLLTEIYQRALTDIDRLGLSMKRPLAFTIDHVYADNLKHARSSDFRMKSSPEEYLKARNFL